MPYITVGATYYNDAPPGAFGMLDGSRYYYAELGTATRQGQATGVGNLARAFGLQGELTHGTPVYIRFGHAAIVAVKGDRGYGQGGDGIHSDPHYAIDLWDGSANGGKNLPGDLGFSGIGDVRVELIQGPVFPADRPSPGQAFGPAPGAPGPGAFGQLTGYLQAAQTSEAQHDYSQKIVVTGRNHSLMGNHFQGHAAALRSLLSRHVRL